MHAGTENNFIALVGPGHHNIVGAHPVGHIVASQGGGVSQPLRHPAFGGHQIHFGVAVILPGKGDLAAIRRKTGIHFVPLVTGQPAGNATVYWNGVQIAGIGKDNLLPVGRRKTQ